MGGETLWAMTDALGNVKAVIDTDGNLRIHRNFDSFGNIASEDYYGDHVDEPSPSPAAGSTKTPVCRTISTAGTIRRWAAG
jgi:hypothetical protein